MPSGRPPNNSSCLIPKYSILSALLLLLNIISSDARSDTLALEKARGPIFGVGASEWWDAVTGDDEFGDKVTTFMHKRWGTAIQLYHANRLTFTPFRFIPSMKWIVGGTKGRAQAINVFGRGIEVAEYWFARLHLEELAALRNEPSVIPQELELGRWRGRRFGSAYVLQNNDVAFDNEDDDFLERRRLVLLEDGFIYMGSEGVAVTVQFDDEGRLVPPAKGAIEHVLDEDACFRCSNEDIRSAVLPGAIGLSAKVIEEDQAAFVRGIMAYQIQRRADSPAARLLAPQNYKRTSEGWRWCGKGSGHMLDGSAPYGE